MVTCRKGRKGDLLDDIGTEQFFIILYYMLLVLQCVVLVLLT